MMPAVTNTEAANQEMKLSSRISWCGELRDCSEGDGNKGLVHQQSWPHRFRAHDSASTLDERGLWGGGSSSSGPTEGVAAWTRPLGKKSRNHPSKKLYGAWPGIIVGSSSVARMHGMKVPASIEASPFMGPRQGRVYACPSVRVFALSS